MHAYNQHQKEAQKNPKAKLDQIRLINSYEFVLKQFGLNPLTDGYFYKILMKLETSKKDLFGALESEIEKNNKQTIAIIHYEKCLQAKSYFALVQNMVNSKIYGQSYAVQIQEPKKEIINRKSSSRQSKRRSSKENKENAAQISNKNSSRVGSRASNNKPLVEVDYDKTYNKAQNAYFPQEQNIKNKTQQISKCNTARQGLKRDSTKISLNQDNMSRLYNDFLNQQAFSHDSTDIISARSENRARLEQTGRTTMLSERSNNQKAETFRKMEQINDENDSRFSIKAQDFKIMLTSLRKWKNYVKEVKQSRIDEQKFLQQWALSIHFYEQTLMTKSFLSLQSNLLRGKEIVKKLRVYQKTKETKIKRRCFRQWNRNHKNRQERMSKIFKALNHWGMKLSTKSFSQWKHHLLQQKHSRLINLDRFLEKPFSIISLLLISNFTKVSSFQQLFQVLHKSMPKRFHEFIPYLTSSIQRYYLQKIFQQMKNDCIKGQEKLLMTEKIHFMKIFRRWRNASSKRLRLKKQAQMIIQIKDQKILFSSFAHWLNLTSDKVMFQQNKSKAFEFYEKTLKLKALQGFLIYLTHRQQSQSALRKSRYNNLSKLMQKTFAGWKFMSFYNRKYRSLTTQGRLIHHRGSLSHYFMQWIKTAIIVCKSRVHYEKTLKLKLFRVLLTNLERKESMHQAFYQSKLHYQQKLAGKIIAQWIKFTQKSQVERTLKRTIFKYIRQSKQKKVINAWREKITVRKGDRNLRKIGTDEGHFKIKRKALRALKEFTENKISLRERMIAFHEQHLERQKQISILGWLQLFNKKLLLRRNFRTFSIHHLQILLHHYFTSWNHMSKNQLYKKNNFYRGRAYNLLSIGFNNLKKFTQQRLIFKARLHDFLKLRAKNILQQALIQMRAFTQANEVNRKMRKVATFIFLERTLRKCFNQINEQAQENKSFKMIQHRVNHRTGYKFFQVWKIKYLRKDIVKRFRLRAQVEKQVSVFQRWRIFAKNQSKKNHLIHQGLQRKYIRLALKSLKGFKINVNKKQNKRMILGKAYNIYLMRLIKNIITNWFFYVNTQRQKKELFSAYIEKSKIEKVLKIFNFLKQRSKQKSFYKNQLKPFIRSKQRRTLRTCLVSLYKYSFEKSILKANFERHQMQKRQIKAAETLNAFYRYKQYSQYMRELKQRSQNFLESNLLRKSFYCLVRNRLVHSYTKSILKQSQLNQMHRYLQKWILAYNDQQVMKPLESTTDLYLKRKFFVRFIQNITVLIQKRLQNGGLQMKAKSYYRQKLIARTYQIIKQFSQINQLSKMKKQLAQKIFLKKVFYKWKFNQQMLKRDKTQVRILNHFRAFSLQRQAFKQLKKGVNICKKQIQKCQNLQYEKELIVIKKYYKALLLNAVTQRKLKDTLSLKLKVLDRIEIKPKFQQWVNVLKEHQQEDQAKQFRLQRGYQYIMRKFFDCMKIYYLQKKNEKIIANQISIRHDRGLKRKALINMILAYNRNLGIKDKLQNYQKRKQSNLKEQLFHAFLNRTFILRRKREQTLQANHFYMINAFKKVVISLQKNICLSQLFRIVQSKNHQTLAFKSLQKWKMSFLQSRHLNNLVRVLDNSHSNQMKQNFFQRLVKLAFYQQIFETLQNKRLTNYALTFVNLLKRNLIYNQIVHGYTFAKNIDYKRRVLQGLVMNLQEGRQKNTMIESQLNIVIDQANNDMMKSTFNALRQFSQESKLKKYALKVYVHKLMRKSFMSIQFLSLRQQTEYYATTQIRIKREYKYFCLWIQAIQKRQQQRMLDQVHNSNLMKQIISEWRDYTQKQKAAQFFHVIKLKQRVQPLAFNAIQSYTQRQRYLKFCETEISNNVNYQLVKNVMLNWMEYHNLKRIQLNMQRFYQYKVLKSVINEWREVSERGIADRRQILEIRNQLYERPQLVKPLLVIRNVLLYKAFQLFKLGATLSNHEVTVRTNLTYHAYLRLIRKSFYSLKLNVSKRQQRRKLRQLRNMFMMRRWLYNLRAASQVRKDERQKRTQALIFGVLNSQKKAFDALLHYASVRQQQRIKSQFADELYYKRLADKVIMAFRINQTLNKEEVRSGNRTLLSSEVRRPIDQTLMSSGLGQSRYEQDLSALQMECSQVIDWKEKKRLIKDLYDKKTLYKCFFSWANLALSVSEDEGDESYGEQDNNNQSYDYYQEDGADEVAQVQGNLM